MKLESVGTQTPDLDGTDYGCPYPIKGHDQGKIAGICGRDSFQAFELAWNTIGVKLGIIEKKSGDKLVWKGNNGDEPGFPKPNWKD